MQSIPGPAPFSVRLRVLRRGCRSGSPGGLFEHRLRGWGVGGPLLEVFIQQDWGGAQALEFLISSLVMLMLKGIAL